MATRFTALEPSFSLTGSSPIYRIRFIDDLTGNPVDPDSVDSLRVFDAHGTQLRIYIPPDINNPAVGEYHVQELVLQEEGVLQLLWTYTVGGNQISISIPFEVVDKVTNATETMIKEHVLQSLGQGHMRVDLPAGTLEMCLYRAKQWYVQHIGQNKRIEIALLPSQGEYDLPADVYYVTDVTFSSNLSRVSDALGAFGIYGFSMLGISSIPVQDIYGMSSGANGFYSSIVQALQYAEMGSRILSSELSWEYTPWNNKLVVYPPPGNGGPGFVDYVSADLDLSQGRAKEYNFVFEYTLALAKEALGRIRGKYQSLPGVEGSIVMDADQLLAESAEAKRDLNERIRYWAPPGWIITG